MPASASMVVVAIAIPNRPARLKVRMIPAMMVMAGRAVDSRDTARPWMTFVPCPEDEASATDFTGR